MNFWEARQAALSGKTVRALDGFEVPYYAEDFTDKTGWQNDIMALEWELVEEPKHFTNYVNIYTIEMFDWTAHATKNRADRNKGDNRIACIAITVDENGKLISARNV